MLVRIVKMRFKEEEIDTFLSNFDTVKEKIRGFEGNHFLELYQDKNDKQTFFTHSYWENNAALEKYRNSELFQSVWQYTKTLFVDKPMAWSLNKVVSLQ